MQPENSISLIIPAFQEEKRIGPTIKQLSEYLERRHPGAEMIVVCDGCTDGTARQARNNFQAPSCSLKVIELEENQGKGAAVKQGVEEAQGDYVFFTDADLSFTPETMDEFLPKLEEGAQVVIAQRKKETVYRGFGRRTVAVLSRFLIGNFVLPGIRDSQAGYKGFARPAARELFGKLTTKRFLFDLELLVIARRKNYKIEKVYVDWENQPGSTVRLIIDTLRSLRDLLLILLRAQMGRYD